MMIFSIVGVVAGGCQGAAKKRRCRHADAPDGTLPRHWLDERQS